MMPFKHIAAPVALAVMACALPAGAEEPVAPTKGEAKLAKMLEGRVAGQPQSCIRMYPQMDLTVIDKTALVYRSGKTLYVNIPDNPASIDSSDTIVTRSSNNQLCNTTIVTTVDRSFGGYTGNIMLGRFVPYRKES